MALATPVPAFASPASSASAATTPTTATPAVAPVAAAPRPRPLNGALLTADDLPNGYRTTPGDAGGMSMMTDINTDTDICAQRVGSTVPKGPSVTAAFTKSGTGTMLFQSLATTGAPGARAIVRSVAAAPRKCPAVLVNLPTSGQKARLHLAPMRVTRLGDAAAGLRFTVGLPDVARTVQGRMISVAYRGVALTIMLIGGPQVSPQEAGLIAATAVRKLRRLG
ncbi:hypothetical protein [Paractinoplanes ferrugineus]|uniref:hypothetical protein n=1 Tax=Paractinoplanes ferrugineus TaxID=113564 RepID=UPI0031E138AB